MTRIHTITTNGANDRKDLPAGQRLITYAPEINGNPNLLAIISDRLITLSSYSSDRIRDAGLIFVLDVNKSLNNSNTVSIDKKQNGIYLVMNGLQHIGATQQTFANYTVIKNDTFNDTFLDIEKSTSVHWTRKFIEEKLTKKKTFNNSKQQPYHKNDSDNKNPNYKGKNYDQKKTGNGNKGYKQQQQPKKYQVYNPNSGNYFNQPPSFANTQYQYGYNPHTFANSMIHPNQLAAQQNPNKYQKRRSRSQKQRFKKPED